MAANLSTIISFGRNKKTVADETCNSQSEDKLVLCVLERKSTNKKQSFSKKGSSVYVYKELNFYCIFKHFHKKLRLSYNRTPTLVFREKQLRFSSSVQFADFVCKLTRPSENEGLVLFIAYLVLIVRSAQRR